MNYRELVEICGKENVIPALNEESGIVSVTFHLNDICFTCQYGSVIDGLYGFSFDQDSARKLLDILKEHAENSDDDNE